MDTKNVSVARKIFEAICTEIIFKLFSLVFKNDIIQLTILGVGSVVTLFVIYRPTSFSTFPKFKLATLIRALMSLGYLVLGTTYYFVSLDNDFVAGFLAILFIIMAVMIFFKNLTAISLVFLQTWFAFVIGFIFFINYFLVNGIICTLYFFGGLYILYDTAKTLK